ncbi:hypothetical protein [Candidatus Paracaedibacter symbiosus]|uniref:hypothetical protein n=1 Tax=Candidatus Paracaedibacter symbiosus TaxID=244582 RepID=UPI000509B77F|nr:hypothetical protein [Candidatus Paracaedibacter symbiosus]
MLQHIGQIDKLHGHACCTTPKNEETIRQYVGNQLAEMDKVDAKSRQFWAMQEEGLSTLLKYLI